MHVTARMAPSAKLHLLAFLVFLADFSSFTLAVECNRETCSVSAQKISLTCGSKDETITTISVAGLQAAGWACGAAANSFNSSCNATTSNAVRAAIEAACMGKTECEIDPATLNRTECPGRPQLAVNVGCEASSDIDPLTILALAFVAFVMLSLGATLEWTSFMAVVREKKRGVLIGWMSQFGVMPLLSFIMVKAANFEQFVAAGVILCGCAPGGSTSNLFTHWSGGDVALSITMSTMSTLCAVFMFPLLVFIYIDLGVNEGQGTGVVIPFSNIVISLLAIVIPAGLGMLIRNKTTCMIGSYPIYVVIEKVGSGLGALFLVGAMIAAISADTSLFAANEHPVLFFFAIIFQPLGCFIGFGIAVLLKMDHRARIAVSLETGVQNFPMVIAVVALSFTGCDRVRCLAFALMCSFFYVLNSAWIVLLFRFAPCFRGPDDEQLDKPDKQPDSPAPEAADSAGSPDKAGGELDKPDTQPNEISSPAPEAADSDGSPDKAGGEKIMIEME